MLIAISTRRSILIMHILHRDSLACNHSFNLMLVAHEALRKQITGTCNEKHIAKIILKVTFASFKGWTQLIANLGTEITAGEV